MGECMPSVSAKRIVALMFLRMFFGSARKSQKVFEYVCVCCCSAATAAGVGTHEIMCRGYCSALVQIQCVPVCASVRLCAFVRLCVPVCAQKGAAAHYLPS